MFIASFTTCFARLKLYELLDTLQRSVLYYDTDSVIYTTGPGEQSLPVGDYLGDLTDELDGGYITEFVSSGSKNYAYRTSTGEETQLQKLLHNKLYSNFSNSINLICAERFKNDFELVWRY